MILNTINDVQAKNKANPNEETADPTVFDLIKSKLQRFDDKNREKRTRKGKSPSSILDLIKKEINGARRENKKDPNVPTAPKSVFDQILKRIDQTPQRQASAGIRKIIQDCRIDVSKVPQEVLRQVQDKYVSERKNFDQHFAQALHDLSKKF